jgi:hypothetical protein
MTVLLNLNGGRKDGTWVIQSASGGLAGLHGGGEWIVSGGVNEYEGRVHFGPP